MMSVISRHSLEWQIPRSNMGKQVYKMLMCNEQLNWWFQMASLGDSRWYFSGVCVGGMAIWTDVSLMRTFMLRNLDNWNIFDFLHQSKTWD